MELRIEMKTTRGSRYYNLGLYFFTKATIEEVKKNTKKSQKDILGGIGYRQEKSR